MGFKPSYVAIHIYDPNNNNVQVAYVYNADKAINKVGILGIAPNAYTYGGSFVNLGTTVSIFNANFSFNLTDDGFKFAGPGWTYYYFAIKK